MVWTQISEAGLALLGEMDPVILEVPRELLGHLEREQLAELIRLLELARNRDETPLSCSGERTADPQVVAGEA